MSLKGVHHERRTIMKGVPSEQILVCGVSDGIIIIMASSSDDDDINYQRCVTLLGHSFSLVFEERRHGAPILSCFGQSIESMHQRTLRASTNVRLSLKPLSLAPGGAEGWERGSCGGSHLPSLD
mmetsp:Transcript_40238/g.78864  ORF Transcript_40238/g.78864 Transcript_40238/m.78864 type:complete len:124 (-) Transcript_40238:96-467(-)